MLLTSIFFNFYRVAEKSLARPGRKQGTATKLYLLQNTQKKKIRSLSVQPGLRGSNDLRIGRKMATFKFFFSRIGLRTYQHPCNASFLAQPHTLSRCSIFISVYSCVKLAPLCWILLIFKFSPIILENLPCLPLLDKTVRPLDVFRLLTVCAQCRYL